MVRQASIMSWLLLTAVGFAQAQPAAPPADADSPAKKPGAAEQSDDANPPAPREPRRGRGGFGGPIELGPDDKPAFDDPPADFNRSTCFSKILCARPMRASD